MHIKQKWLAAVAVVGLAMAGVVASTAANATVEPEIFVAEDGSCYVVVHHDAVYEPGEHHDAIAAQHYSLKGNSGIGQAEVPATPETNPDIWQANTAQEPHYAGGATPAEDADGAYVDGESGLHFTSHGSEGLRDWFYFQPAVDAWDDDPILVTEAYDENVTVDCPVVGIPALFDVPTTAATCTDPETFDAVFPLVREGYTITVDRPYDGPGVYTLTAVPDEGVTLTGDTTVEVTLTGAIVDEVLCPTGIDEPPAPLTGESVSAVSECVVPADGTATVTTTTTAWVQEFVWVEDDSEDGGSWVLGEVVYGDPVVTTSTVDDEGCAPGDTPPGGGDDAPPATPVEQNPSFTG